jgi:hypothetical protein
VGTLTNSPLYRTCTKHYIVWTDRTISHWGRKLYLQSDKAVIPKTQNCITDRDYTEEDIAEVKKLVMGMDSCNTPDFRRSPGLNSSFSSSPDRNPLVPNMYEVLYYADRPNDKPAARLRRRLYLQFAKVVILSRNPEPVTRGRLYRGRRCRDQETHTRNGRLQYPGFYARALVGSHSHHAQTGST